MSLLPSGVTLRRRRDGTTCYEVRLPGSRFRRVESLDAAIALRAQCVPHAANSSTLRFGIDMRPFAEIYRECGHA